MNAKENRLQTFCWGCPRRALGSNWFHPSLHQWHSSLFRVCSKESSSQTFLADFLTTTKKLWGSCYNKDHALQVSAWEQNWRRRTILENSCNHFILNWPTELTNLFHKKLNAKKYFINFRSPLIPLAQCLFCFERSNNLFIAYMLRPFPIPSLPDILGNFQTWRLNILKQPTLLALFFGKNSGSVSGFLLVLRVLDFLPCGFVNVNTVRNMGV